MICLELHPWPGSLNQLKDKLLNSRIKDSAMFDPTGTGTIKIVALLNALPDKLFSYPKDKIFGENIANTIPDFLKTLETNFDNYKTTLTLESTSSTTSAGSTALAVVNPTPSTSNCVMCQKPFPK